MNKKRMIKGIIVLSIIIASLYVYREFNRTNPDMRDLKELYSVNAMDIIHEFTENDSLANQKYLGNIIAVRGILKNIDKDEQGNVSLVLGDTTSMSSVRCAMDSSFRETSKLTNGSLIAVKGSCTGFNENELVGSDVILNRCVIIKN